MTKLNIELSEEDEKKLNELKKEFGLTKNSEVVRFCINYMHKNKSI